MAITVPNPPYKTPVTDDRGLMAPSWVSWFREVFNRIGGNVALSNTELAGGSSESLGTLSAAVAALQNDVASLELNSDFDQGPVL